MTYLAFLILFVILPTVAFFLYARRWLTRRMKIAIAATAVIAFVYTTPWDNFLVASGVWYYNPALVLNVIIGWVPLEEYTFFVMMTFFTGLFTFILTRVLYPADVINTYDAPLAGDAEARTLVRSADLPLNVVPLSVVGTLILIVNMLLIVWLATGHMSAVRDFADRNSYLVLIVGWAGPVVLAQLIVGWAAFRERWKAFTLGIALPTIYLTFVDSFAIGGGTWTIDINQSTGIFLPRGVPLEEGVFFLVVNTLIVQGVLLIASPEGQVLRDRWVKMLRREGRIKPAALTE